MAKNIRYILIGYKIFYKAIFLLFLFLFVLILPFERMSVSSYFVIIFFTLLFILSLFLTRDLASPQVILCLTWSISLFLTSLDITFVNRVSHFNEMLSIQTWILIYISILCFFIGSTITMYPTRSGLRQKIGKNKLNWNSKLLDFIIYISFGIAFLVYLFAVIRNGGVPAFSDNISNARSDFIPGTLGIFLTLFQLVPMITIFKVVKSGFKSNKLPIFLSLISIICSLLTTQRIAAVETILMSGILFLVLWPYTSEEIKKIRRKTFLYVGVIFSILFIRASY